jgi:hypothetical protein
VWGRADRPYPSPLTTTGQEDTTVSEKAKKKTHYTDHLPENGLFTEDDLWQAIADANGVDVSEIADGDLVDWL